MNKIFLDSLAKQFGLEPELILAVAEVESNNKSGFQKSGLLTILFEAHLFYKELRKRMVKSASDAEGLTKFILTVKNNPNLLSKDWNRTLYKYGDGENKRMAQALKIHPCAALCASYGKFQILGMHYGTLGFKTVDEYIAFLNESEENHLICFLRFLAANPTMLRKLKLHDWAGFAELYNGKGFKINRYDTKIRDAYIKYKKINSTL